MSDDQASAPTPVKRGAVLFKKGQSGNPAGRPKGAIGAITLLKRQMDSELRVQLKPHMGAILDKAIEFALKGDPDMIKLLLDKCISVARASDEDEPPREKVQIIIQRLNVAPQVAPTITVQPTEVKSINFTPSEKNEK